MDHGENSEEGPCESERYLGDPRPGSAHFPALLLHGPSPGRLRDFFSSHIRNKNSRRAYLEAVRQFSEFCPVHGIADLAHVEPVGGRSTRSGRVIDITSVPGLRDRALIALIVYTSAHVGAVIGIARRGLFRAGAARLGSAS